MEDSDALEVEGQGLFLGSELVHLLVCDRVVDQHSVFAASEHKQIG